MESFCGGLAVAGTEKVINLGAASKPSPPRAESRPGSDLSTVVRCPGLGSGAVGACGRHSHPGASGQTSPVRAGTFWWAIAGPAASGVGLADAGVLQQPQTGEHAKASGFVQEADTPPEVSNAPTNAARAIHECRSLVRVMGMVPSETRETTSIVRIGWFMLVVS